MRNTSSSTSADKSVTVSCATGDTVLGGGGETNNADATLQISAPVTSGTGTNFTGGTWFPGATGWTAAGAEDGNLAASWTVSAWVVCANSSAGGGPPGP